MDDMTQFLLRLLDHSERIAQNTVDTCRQTRAHVTRGETLHRQTIEALVELRALLDRLTTAFDQANLQSRQQSHQPLIAPPSRCLRALPVTSGVVCLALGLLIGHSFL
jgi:hypothetical protein